MGAPAMAAYETSVGSFKCRGMTIPKYSGKPYAVVNNNKTQFTAAEKASRTAYEVYSDLDSSGRVGIVTANIDKTSLPNQPRGDISSIYPTGWKQNKYAASLVDGTWLYNRSHLYAHSLGGDDIKNNLCTGCRSFNVNGMYYSTEDPVLSHVKKSKDHVLYRVTPVFFGKELLARGVLLEAESLESESINICVFCYNVQPGIAIDYATGANKLASGAGGSREKTNIKSAKVAKIPAKIYTGKYIRPVCFVTDGQGRYLKKGTDYLLRYNNNLKPGKASVKISGIGNYSGSQTAYYYIKPARMKIAYIKSEKPDRTKNGRMTVKWKRHPGVTGYQLKYGIVGSSKTKTVGISGASVKKELAGPKAGLKRGKKYKVQLWAYKKVDGRTFYGQYSKSKKIKIK